MVGSLRWIYNVLQQGVLTHPREKLLHYVSIRIDGGYFLLNILPLCYFKPLPVGEITGARDVIVCSTNFTTEARHDIVEMCKDMGIKFSASLSRSTTHLITA